MRQLLVSVPLLLLVGSLWVGYVSSKALEDTMLDSVEHEVEDRDAFYAARELFRSKPLSKAGCSECTSQDMDYCLGEDLLHDHCCCDRNIPERYPFVPHVCYKHDVPLCEPVAPDCEEYFRVDICCCQPYLRPQWQYHSWKKSSATDISSSLLFVLVWYLLITKLA